LVRITSYNTRGLPTELERSLNTLSYMDASNIQALADGRDVHNEKVLDREQRMQQLVNRKLEDMHNSRLKIIVCGKEVIVRDVVGKIVGVIISAKSYISSAVSAEPHAALAWAGILVILPVSIFHTYLLNFSPEAYFPDLPKPGYSGQGRYARP